MSDRPNLATKMNSHADAESLQLAQEHHTGEIHAICAVYRAHDSRHLAMQTRVWTNPPRDMIAKLDIVEAEWYVVSEQDRGAFVSTILENHV